MKYFLVALFDRESSLLVEAIQRSVCKKYRFHKNVSSLHLTLDVVGDPDLDKLVKVVSDVLKPYKKFKIELDPSVNLDNNSRFVNLKVESKGYISRIARNINCMLKLHGFEVREHGDNIKLNIPIGSVSYSQKEQVAKELIAVAQSDNADNNHKMIKVDRIEIWKNIPNKKEALVRSFPLREF